MPKVDFDSYQGREQAYIKHCLLQEYLPELGWKVGSQWDSIVYVDGFAGPWNVQKPDFADSSFGIAVSTLDRVAKGLNENRAKQVAIQCALVEEDKEAFTQLDTFAKNASRPGFRVDALYGEFVERISDIEKLTKQSGKSPFKFVFLDPKGWKDIPMQRMTPFLKDRSCEVVVNLMTRFIIRFLDEPDRADSYRHLFGRDDVLAKLQAVSAEERHDALVREYCKSLHYLCEFKYVSSAVILEPNRDDIRYFLVYGTNHHRGVEVFKAAETKAARIQDQIRHEAEIRKSGGQDNWMRELFGETSPRSDFAHALWKRYCQKARRKVISRILDSPAEGVEFAQLFCDAMAFPMVTPTDLQSLLTEIDGAIDIRLEGDGKRKKPSPDKKDFVLAKDRGWLETLQQK